MDEARQHCARNWSTALEFQHSIYTRFPSFPKIDLQYAQVLNSDAETNYSWTRAGGIPGNHAICLRPTVVEQETAHVFAHELMHVWLSSARYEQEQPRFRIPGCHPKTASRFFLKHFNRCFGDDDRQFMTEVIAVSRNWALDILVEGRISSHPVLQGLFSSQVVSIVDRCKRSGKKSNVGHIWNSWPRPVATKLLSIEAGFFAYCDYLFSYETRLCDHYLKRLDMDAAVRSYATDICAYAIKAASKQVVGTDCDFADDILRIVGLGELIDWVMPAEL
ncbi:MAG: hypothetical protein U1F83_19565 [Verrucomicrobiota bacterium]